MIGNYVGRKVDVIYQDGKGQITKRLVSVQAIKGEHVFVYDLDKQAPRTLRIDGILAVMRNAS